MEKQLEFVNTLLATGGAVYTICVFALSFLFPQKKYSILIAGFGIAFVTVLTLLLIDYFRNKVKHLYDLRDRVLKLEDSIKIDSRFRKIEEKLIKQDIEVSLMKSHKLFSKRANVTVYLILLAVILVALYVTFVMYLRSS